MDDQTSWQKQLLVGVVLLLVVGALIGGVVAFAGIKAVDLAGLGKAGSTTAPITLPGGGGGTPPKAHRGPHSGSPTSAPPTHRPPPQRGIVLRVHPNDVGSFEPIYLTGTYQAPTGLTLQVQRKESGTWLDFPVTTSLDAGAFSTYVKTSHTGLNRFRMKDVARGETSNRVTVTVG